MQIRLTSVLVNDQDKALAFYTEILGFVKKTDLPAGEYKFLTVVSPEGSADVELLLEPNENPAGRTFQAALHEQGIPLTAFYVENVQQEYERLLALGVTFTTTPTENEFGSQAVFEDTVGNLIMIYQPPSA